MASAIPGTPYLFRPPAGPLSLVALPCESTSIGVICHYQLFNSESGGKVA
jgi:hypothetical protein